MKRHHINFSASLKFGALIVFMAGIAIPGSAGAAGIVESIDKSSNIADGNVTGMPTDIVISLNGSDLPASHSRASPHSIFCQYPPLVL